MKAVWYYIFYAFTWVIMLLPLRVLYLLSDFIFLLLYYFPSYRRDVVRKNLERSFPNMEAGELRRTGRKYYRHLADLFVETLKVTHMSATTISRRFRFRDMSLLERLYGEGRDVVAVCSHYNNWEWLSSMPLFTGYQATTIYKPLKNKYFDGLMLSLRSKYGVVACPMQNILRELVRTRKNNIRTVTAFIADQTPPPDEHTYWTTFLNQDTGFYTGAEKIAVMFDMAVVFVHIIKVRRGFYEVETKLITDQPKQEKPGFITGSHARMLEEVIRQEPAYWLWSHRRWKHKRATI